MMRYTAHGNGVTAFLITRSQSYLKLASSDYGVIKEKIRADLKRYIVKETSRRPLIMPVILEV